MDTQYWIFANKYSGHYGDSDWDMNSILEKQRYYLKKGERNRAYVSEGDIAYLRIYGDAYIGWFEVGEWENDPDASQKHGQECGSFEMKNLNLWQRRLPQGLIIRDLSNQDHRSRIVSITKDDAIRLDASQKTYERLGFGGADGEIIILEKGIEEAIIKNLKDLGLELASEDIQQQFYMGPDVGRSDLICLDFNKKDLVVIELKRGTTSDEAIGQILRYVGYVKENIATEDQKVKGWIVTGDYDEHLRLAASAAGIKLLMVRI